MKIVGIYNTNNPVGISCLCSYNKNQRDALFLKFIFDKEFYIFRTDLMSIIRSLNIVYAAIGICHASYVDCLLANEMHYFSNLF
jgi:hypothetical protein